MRFDVIIEKRAKVPSILHPSPRNRPLKNPENNQVKSAVRKPLEKILPKNRK